MRTSLLLTVLALALVGGVQAAQAAGSLNIALEAPMGAKVRQSGDVFEQVEALLIARGHTVTVVSGVELDTSAEISAFDVVVLNGTGFDEHVDLELFDAQVEPYVNSGGGLVSTGWGVYWVDFFNTPGIETVLPFAKGMAWVNFGTITVLQGHPITDGLSNFANPNHDNYGGGPRAGATVLTRNGAIDDSAAWGYGSGRVVYLGPIFLADYSNYSNEPLLDGSTPDARELFLRAVEWAGGQGISASAVPSLSVWGLIALAGMWTAAIRWQLRRRRGQTPPSLPA